MQVSSPATFRTLLSQKSAYLYAAFLLGAVHQSAFAQVSITDTVVVGANEWAQPADFTGNNWAAMNTACPNGDCDAGSGMLNGFNLTGWRWATGSEVGDLLYANTIPGYPGGLVDFQAPDANSTWAPAFFDSLGFRATASDTKGRYAEAYLADTSTTYTSLGDLLPSSGTPDEVRNFGANPLNTDLGIWLYRPDTTPPASPEAIPILGPAGLVTLAMGLLFLALRKFRKSSNSRF